MAMFGDYVSLNAPTRNADQRNYTLGQHYNNATPVAATGSLAVVPAAWGHAPITTTTIASHTISTTTDFAHPRRLFASPSSSPEPNSTLTPAKSSHKSTRAPSNNASKSTRLHGARFSRSSIPPTDNTPATKRYAQASPAGAPRNNNYPERNRVAASKCRQRKKEWVCGLEKAKKRFETQNSQLQLEHNRLLGEVNFLKNQIMAHANCHDAKIDKWIEKEARRLAEAPESTDDVGYGRLPDASVPPSLIDFQFGEQVVPETPLPGGEPSQNPILDSTLLAADIGAETTNTVQPNSSATHKVKPRV